MWIPFGDSLTSPAGGGAPDVGWTVQTGMVSDGQLVEYRNAGVPGDNAADMLARVNADVVAYAPTVVSVWVGTNDITQGRTLAAYQSDVTDIVTALRTAGVRPVLLTIPPRADTTKHATIGHWNLWLKRYAEVENLDLVDAYTVLADPATGTYKSGYDSGDGIHISIAGHNAVAVEFVAQMVDRLPAWDALRPRFNIDANNLITNGLLLDNDDASPSIPDGWSRSGSTTGITEALVDDADFHGGKAWEVAMSSPGGLCQFLQNCSSGWSVGDTLLWVAKVKVVSASGISSTKGLRVNANHFGAASPTTALVRYLRLGGLGGLVVKRVTVPTGTTGPVQLACVFDIDTTASATFRVGEFGVYNLTALGLT